ncbi:unnamed protein product [Protopolystoma xenopodis]|uniref:Uncharacterized protein n=1 Tax=Protopolystoma xenopodis TaxID=117903 RepID=A0A448WMS3_9PLAT|nr:unnamed protein product [Protopolystoma xenopodis]
MYIQIYTQYQFRAAGRQAFGEVDIRNLFWKNFSVVTFDWPPARQGLSSRHCRTGPGRSARLEAWRHVTVGRDYATAFVVHFLHKVKNGRDELTLFYSLPSLPSLPTESSD